MKKYLSFVLMLCMLLSVAAPTLVLAEDTNLALGKEVANAENVESLIPGEGADWVKTDVNGASVEVAYDNGTVFFFGSMPDTWPSVYVEYQEPITADVDNDLLSIDFTVEGGATNINFFLDIGDGSYYAYSISNTALMAACPEANVDCVGDLHDGVYSCTISIADLVSSFSTYMSNAFPADAVVDGKISFVGINVYSVNGALIEVNDLSIVHNDAEEPDIPDIPDVPEVPDVPAVTLPITGIDSANTFCDRDICYYPAGDADRVLSSDDYNFRYVYILVCDAEGNIIELGNNLLTTTEEDSKGIDFQNDVTVPAGGFAVSYYYNSSNTANRPLHDVYTSITGETEEPSLAIYNETKTVEAEPAYKLACDGRTLWILDAASEAPDFPDVPDVPEPPVAGGNLAAGKSYTTTAIYTTNGVQNWPDEGGVTLTDGIKAEIGAGYSDPVWVGFNKQSPDYDSSENGLGAVTIIDLGTVTDISKVAFQACKDGDVGITVPYWVNLAVSDDGENFNYAGFIEINPDAAPSGVNAYEATIDVTARYVRVCFYGYGWMFIDEIEVFGAEGTDTPVDPEPENKTYENTLTVGEDGVASVEVPYGYTWNVNYINDVIRGEDITICTTQDAYNVCNPNWAITIYAELQEDGTYVALQDAIICPGSAEAAGITVGDNRIALVVHSSSSRPSEEAIYYNWLSKVVACAVKAGDVLVVDMDAMTVYAPIPGEGEEPEPSVKYGDANGDGVTNSADVARLMRYLADYDYAAGTSSVEIFAGADCNGDGIVDGRDSVRLLQYLADRETPMAG